MHGTPWLFLYIHQYIRSPLKIHNRKVVVKPKRYIKSYDHKKTTTTTTTKRHFNAHSKLRQRKIIVWHDGVMIKAPPS